MEYNIDHTKEVISIIGKIISKEKIEEALCNDVFLLNCENGKFILKIAKENIRQEELDKEYKILNKLSKHIKLPKVLLYKVEKDYSFFIMEFIKGEKPNDFSDEILKLMAQTLRIIHNKTRTNKLVNFDDLLRNAEKNMLDGRLDEDEFNKDGMQIDPKDVLQFLKDNKPKSQACLLHGDYRPKNMIIKNNNLYILDWGLSFEGDPYYDLAIIKWYFTDDEYAKFIKFYGIKKLDEKRLEYNEWLSAFLNV